MAPQEARRGSKNGNEIGTLDAIWDVMESPKPSGEGFEQLWLLRQCYPRRSAYDRGSSLTVEDAITFGERLLLLTAVHNRWRGRDFLHRAA
jgi:hypothetical protein